MVVCGRGSGGEGGGYVFEESRGSIYLEMGSFLLG